MIQEGRTRNILALLVASAVLIVFVWTSVRVNLKEIWFSNLDQDSVLIFNALRLNDHRAPTYFDHPSLGVYLVYGAIYRFVHFTGFGPVGKFSDLEKLDDPLKSFPGLYYTARNFSIFLAVVCAFLGSWAVFQFRRNWEDAFWGFSFFLVSPGLFFQSLVVRSELTSLLFICLSFLWVAMASRRKQNAGLYFMAGVSFGLAYCTKIQVLPYLGPTEKAPPLNMGR